MGNLPERHIHGCAPGPDHNHAFSQAVAVQIVQVVDGIVNIFQSLAHDPKCLRLPNDCPNEDCLIAISKQVANRDHRTYGRIRAHFDPVKNQISVLELIQNALWRAKRLGRRVDWASCLALWILAVEAPARLV